MEETIIADNQDISALGLRYLLETQVGADHITAAASKKELIDRLLESPCSGIILDYTLFDFERVDELVILEARFPKANWVLFSEELSRDFLRMLLFNTRSFSVLLKECSEEEIVTGLKSSFRGNRYICNHVSNILLETPKNQKSGDQKQLLTATEQEILKEIAMGSTTKEIAAHRFVSVHTVMTHRKNIFRKIEVNNVHEATKYAMRAGIIDPTEYYI